MKLIYQFIANLFNFLPTSNHLHPLQVENCDSNSRLVVDEDDNGKFRPERVKVTLISLFSQLLYLLHQHVYIHLCTDVDKCAHRSEARGDIFSLFCIEHASLTHGAPHTLQIS